MGRRGARRRLAPNIYRDDTGLSVIVKIAGKPHEHRFPPDTPLETLEGLRDSLTERQQRQARPRAHSLAADARAVLETIADVRSHKDTRRLLAPWVAAHGAHSRFSLTPLAVRQLLAAWQRAGAAASTINKRLSALRLIYRTLNTEDQPDPTRGVKRIREDLPPPKALSYPVIARILAAMPDHGKPTKGGTRPPHSLTRRILAVLAYTGLPPAQIARIDPEADIRWAVPALRARPRRKGRGVGEIWLPLVPEAVAALEALAEAHGFRAISRHSMIKSWHRACAKVIREQVAAGEAPIPYTVTPAGAIKPLVSPYILRHSFLTAALASSAGNIKGVQHLAQHADSRTTSRYVQSAIPGLAALAAAAFGASLGASPPGESAPIAGENIPAKASAPGGTAARSRARNTKKQAK